MSERLGSNLESHNEFKEIPQNCVYILTGPNAVGKSSILTRMVDNPSFNASRVVRHTTRPQGINEVDGQTYHFVSRQRFKDMIQEREFVEHAEYLPGYYGTTHEELSLPLRSNRNPVLDLDVDAAVNIKNYLDINGITYVDMFVIPSTVEDLRTQGVDSLLSEMLFRTKRRARGFDLNENEILDRLSYARKWFERITEFKYIIENVEGQLDRAISQIQYINGLQNA